MTIEFLFGADSAVARQSDKARAVRLAKTKLVGPDPSANIARDRIATIVVCVSLAVMITLQAPGRLTNDTKLDLYTDPIDLMHRATALWDGRSGFGYVPNQQWGYLFPIGPFFAVGRMLHIDTWLVQRGWLAGLLILALLGTRRLASSLGIGTPTTRLVAGAAYALSPAMLIHLAQTSAGIPLALAALPWIAAPLVEVQRKGAPSTAALASALAFAAVGSVNATIAVVSLILPALFLLLRARGTRRRSVTAWWVAAIGVTMIGPIIGLLTLKRFGWDFTRITETSADTTATLNATDIVRGSSDWLAYFDLGQPWSPAGQQIVHSPAVILAVGLLTALGVAGLARSDLPERRWLSLAFGVGVVGQAAAYRGVWSGPFAGQYQRLLDGPLVALRNLDKFAPLVALPVALGLAHLLALGRPRMRTIGNFGASAAIVLATIPIATGHLFAAGSFSAVPEYWHQAARFLAESPDSRTLLTPSATFGEYTWGRTLDEPLLSIGRAPWVARAIFPSGGSLQTSRLMDQVDARLSRGAAVPGLAAALARSGIRYVLLRSDLDLHRAGVVEPAVLANALDATPGLSRVRHFGPLIDSAPTADRIISRVAVPLHAIEVFEVADTPTVVSTQPADPVQLVGGLESILNPDVSAFVGPRPIVVDGDGANVLPTTSVIVGDGLRLRDRNFSDARGSVNASYTLGAYETPVGTNRPGPLDLTDPSESLSIAGDDGAHISASSSFSALVRFPEAQPYAAFDRDPFTSWMPDPRYTDGTGEWIEASFPSPRDLKGATIRLLYDSWGRPTVSAIRVVTERGKINTLLKRTSEPQTIAVPSGDSRYLRLEVLDVEGYPGGASQVGISEIALPGLQAGRPLITPSAPSGSTPSFFFERTSSADLNPTRWPEEPQLDRLFTTSAAGEFDLLAQASLRQPAQPDSIASYAAAGTVHSAATTSWFGRSAVSASGAIDSDPSTAWVADPFDQAPTLTIAWDAPQRLTGIHIVGAGAPYRSPSEVIVRTRNGTAQQVKLVDGFAPLSPLYTTKVAVQVVRSAVDFSQATSVIPAAVAIQQVTFDGSDDRLDRAAIPNLECGDGPTIKIDDIEIPTRPTGSIRAILAGGPVPLALCGDRSLRLGSGIHRLSETGAGAFALSSFAATNVSATSKSLAKREASVLRWDNSDRVVAVGPGPQTVLSVAENFNEGWTATFLGRELPRVRLDGWHQGWVIPAGDAGEIRLRFQPTSTFRVWLVICVTSFAALGVGALMVARMRRNPQPASTERSVATWLGDGAAVLALVLMAGVAALIVPIVRRLRRDPLVHSAVAGAAFLMSTVVSAIGNDARPGAAVGAFSGFAQVCCLVAVACVLVALPSDSKTAVRMPRVRRTRPLRPETE